MAVGDVQDGGTLKRADPRTIQDKFLVGYQGWFTCAGDGEPIHPGHHGWLHWFHNPIPSGGRPNTDLWPDVSEYDVSELFLAPGLTTASGDPVHLFSSRNPKTVRRHFHWMALHGVDGAFLQRFAGQCEIKGGNLGVRNLRDEVGERVREAAEAEGRVYAIMYDVSGVAPEKIQTILEQDWMHLLRDEHLLDSPSYLREKDRPVVALWGFGFDGRKHTPELVRAITDFFRSSTPGGVYLVAGTAGHWRTASSDADRNPEFVQVWTDCFDAISPWTIGRYNNEEGANRWGEERVKADAEYLKKLEAEGGRKVDYIPVVLPGGSGFNLSEGKWGMNDIQRNGGRFLWRQIYNAQRAGVRTIYGAMWDEYDEGTAFMPVVSYSSQLPVHSTFRFIALDIDGHDLPSDWYMRIVGYAAEAFHGDRTLPEQFPLKELQDYWSTRPHREPVREGDVDEVTRTFREWEVARRSANVPNEAPPPYSLEDAWSPAQQQQPFQTRVPPALVAGSSKGGRPPVPLDTRPSAGGAMVPFAAAAVAPAVSGGSSSSSAMARYGRAPPPVVMSTRPSPVAPTSPRPHHPSSSMQIGMAPPVPPRPSHDGKQYHVSSPSLGHVSARPSASSMPSLMPNPAPNSAVGFPVPCAAGHMTTGHAPAGHARGRPGSRSGPKHGSTSRSRSRSSSGSRKRRHSRTHHHHSPQVHSPHPAGSQVPTHPHPSHGHGHGPGPFPGASAGAEVCYTQSESSMHGPVGYGHGHGQGQGPYAPAHSYPVGQVGPVPNQQVAYAAHSASSHQAPVYGYGYGPGPGYPQQQGYGYVAHPSSSPYYASYAPPTGAGPGTDTGRPSGGFPGGSGTGSGNGSGNGSGKSGIQGGIASALQAVEGFAGPSARKQLEKLSNTSLFSKLK